MRRERFSLDAVCNDVSVIPITALLYNITIDADLYSSRVTSRGLFKENNERHLQKNVVVGQAPTCSEFLIHIQVRPPRHPSPRVFLGSERWWKLAWRRVSREMLVFPVNALLREQEACPLG